MILFFTLQIRKQGYEVEKYKTKEGKEESQQVFNIDMMRRSHPQKRFKAKDKREKGKPKNLTSRQKLNKQGMEKSYQVNKMVKAVLMIYYHFTNTVFCS
jgi:hypothetical protein